MAPSSAGSLEGESTGSSGLAAASVRECESANVRAYEPRRVTHTQAQWTNQTKARLITTSLPFISQLTVQVSWKSVWENSERL